MLKLRVITAVVLLLLLLAAVALGRTTFVAAAALLMGAASFEWVRLAGVASRQAAVIGVVYGVLLFAFELMGRTPNGPVLTLIVGGASAVWITLLVLLMQAERGLIHLGRAASIMLCFLLLTAGWVALLYLHSLGIVALLSVLVIVWMADIAAYFAGRAFGRRKLAPRISPGKTWAGVGGAMVGVGLLALFVHLAWPQSPLFTNRLFQALNMVMVFMLLFLLVAISIVGDLFESLLKRQAGVKDSSHLLPGHGGVLDRIDAMLPVLPAAVLIQRWLS